MKILALDAMGVVFQEAHVVGQILTPFLRAYCNVDAERVMELYLQGIVGEFTAAVFWKKLGLSPDVEDEYLQCYQLGDNAKEFLKEARKQFDSVWLLSNDLSEWSLKLRQMFKLDDLFDGFVISGDVHHRKPSPEIYRALLEAASAHPEEIVFVDDRPCNIQAAQSAGMQGVLFGEQSEPADTLSWARDFSELSRLLLSKGKRK